MNRDEILAIGRRREIDQRIAAIDVVAPFQFLSRGVKQNQSGVESRIDAECLAVDDHPLVFFHRELVVVMPRLFAQSVHGRVDVDFIRLLQQIVRFLLPFFQQAADDECARS